MLKVFRSHSLKQMCSEHLAQDLKSIGSGGGGSFISKSRFSAKYYCISVHIVGFSRTSACLVYVNDVSFWSAQF